MRIFITLMGIFTTLSLWAQTGRDSIKRSVNLDEVVISANKTEESKRFVASQINVINSKQIQFSNVQTTGDVLTSTGLIMLQKSQQGGGSPVIRGFEASRILLVVDGVRLNNLIYRGGHLQSAITIDPSVLDKVEVFFGPSSTVYGSDALGGTIHFMTKKPRLDLTGKKPLSVNAMQRYSSVNKGSTTHMNINFGFKKLASFTALTYNSFNNLRMGRTKNPFYDTIYGLRETYVTQMNGKDTILGNNNRYIQAQSGYKQIDMMQKFLYKPSHKVEHQVNVQYSNSTDIPRYDRLTESNNGQPTFAEWYYGPQVRLMTAYDLNLNNTLGFSSIHVGVSYQDIQESRYTRRFKNKNLSARIEDVGVIGYNIDFKKAIKAHQIRFGFDGQANTLKSSAYKKNVETDDESPLDTRYPNGNNTVNHNAVYVTHTYTISSKLALNDGARVGISTLKSEIKDNSFFQLPVTSVTQSNPVYSGYLGLIFLPVKAFKFSYLFSSGYRVPNIDDLSKVFETTAGIVIVPNTALKPEQTLSNEIGMTYNLNNKLRIESTVWYTLFNNAITTGATTLNGLDSIFYDGKMSKVFSNQNTRKAELFGYSVSITANLSNSGQIYTNLGYTQGNVISEAPNQPLDHISPLTANAGYIYSIKKVVAEGYLNFSGKKDILDYSNSGEDNQQYAPKSGMPAWMTINLKLGYAISNLFTLQGGVENIADTQYRVFASGIHGPGRNFYLTARFNY